MAAKVLFFGQDTDQRISTLIHTGYSVDVYSSIAELEPSLVEDSDAVAVAISGVWKPFLHDSISIVRSQSGIPFILFGEPDKDSSQSIFDLVIPARRSSSQWLGEIDLLIRECHATRAKAREVIATSDRLNVLTRTVMEQSRLHREQAQRERESSQDTRKKSECERERSLRESSRNKSEMIAGWHFAEIPGVIDFVEAAPVSIPCEERDKLNWSIMLALAKMTGLLLKATKVRLDNGTSDQIEALLGEERELATDLERLLKQWKSHRALHGC